MAEIRSSKVHGIRHIVRLKGMLQKWHSVTIGSKTSKKLISNANDGTKSPMIKRSKSCGCNSDDEEDSSQSSGPPLDVPKGYLAVYVGPENRRFIIPTSYLSHSLFKKLLEKAAEEFGFDQSGGLAIPCEIETFKYLLECIETSNKEEHDHKAHKACNALAPTEEIAVGNSGTLKESGSKYGSYIRIENKPPTTE